MKVLPVLALLTGFAAALGLVVSEGAGSIWHSAALIGVAGSAMILSYRLAVICCMGVSWWVLGRHRPDARVVRFVWGRLIRDSAGEALPLSQIGGFVIGARALSLAGVSGTFAAASTVVDVSMEVFGQLAYVIVGLGLLQWLRPMSGYATPVLGATLAMGVALCIFMAVQGRGAGLAASAVRRLAGMFLGEAMAGDAGVRSAIIGLHRRYAAMALCSCGHFLWWMVSGLETWITLRLMGLHVSVAAALVVDSFLYGVRSLAFLVPNALGVQEAALMVLAGFFGVGHAPALALSLIKRARDLAIGVPALLVWQAAEGRWAWRKRMKAALE